MEQKIATKSANTDTKIPAGERTDFQIHVSQRTQWTGALDFTEKKLLKLMIDTHDEVKRLSLAALADDYRNGLVAIAWWKGTPTFLRVIKDR